MAADDRRRTLLFLVAALVIIAIDRSGMLAPVLAPWTDATIGLTIILLDRAGLDVVRDGAVLAHPMGFSYEIHYRCTGFLALALYAAALATERGAVREKAVGVTIGALALLCLNLVRLVHLFLVGVEQPENFRIVHELVWQAIMIVAVLTCWGIWRLWMSSRGVGDGGGGVVERVA